ncbi:MAG TPA: helix-turn-helix transcriptional regulator [Streptomyces sp.]|uniref:helix-turn-helix domain-containing protein n=1 Tax=Streptomyces sp. TaxID=1931 RepID=UPI002B61D1A1|nr:helix-turn-helix transcriptional regulator [Streptomyces sp.]HWU08827.1 helix-turn-helix transcriptional regulator [Streptomyces sp.]
MPIRDDGRTGARIRERRRLAHLTQRQLAARLPYSYSLLNQVECGAREASPGLITAVAVALRIDVSVLTEPDTVTTLQRQRLAALVRPIRDAFDLFDLDPDPTVETAPLSELVAAADALCQQVRATRLRAAASELPGVITSLTRIVRTRPGTESWRALASTYRTAHDVALKIGYPDLAAVALDRMGWAAERGSDPCLAAVRQYKRALARQESEGLGQRLVQAGHALLDGETTRESLVVAGQLHLGAVAVAARAGNRTAVCGHLEAARDLARQIGGEAGEVHWLSFGQTNIDLHALGAQVRMKQWDEGLAQARAMRLPPTTPTSRRARYLVDRAVVEMETGHAAASLRHLVDARSLAPEQTRYLQGARDAVNGLVHTMRRPPEGLTHMAAWIGL